MPCALRRFVPTFMYCLYVIEKASLPSIQRHEPLSSNCTGDQSAPSTQKSDGLWPIFTSPMGAYGDVMNGTPENERDDVVAVDLHRLAAFDGPLALRERVLDQLQLEAARRVEEELALVDVCGSMPHAAPTRAASTQRSSSFAWFGSPTSVPATRRVVFQRSWPAVAGVETRVRVVAAAAVEEVAESVRVVVVRRIARRLRTMRSPACVPAIADAQVMVQLSPELTTDVTFARPRTVTPVESTTAYVTPAWIQRPPWPPPVKPYGFCTTSASCPSPW
jgi:hypothetical protein